MADLSKLTPGTWTVDASHSTIGFVARHLVVAKTRGRFGTFEGTITIAENPLESKVVASADTASVNTNDDNRDNHLRTGDFFEADTYPKITFVSTSIEPDGGDYKLNGDLTIKGVTKPVTATGTWTPPTADAFGNSRAHLNLEAIIDRTEWGMNWNLALPSGGNAVGNDVTLTIELSLIEQA